MFDPIRRIACLAAVAATGLCAVAPAAAQPYPSKPIRLIVAYPAGGSSDATARQLAAGLGKRLGQPVVVENKPGANTIIATQLVATAPPDGYTLYFTYTTPYTMNPAMYKKLPYNPEKDVTPIALMAEMLTGIAVNAASSHQTLEDLVRFAKANPGKLSHGSPGTAQVLALCMEIFKGNAGIDIVHVPYQGSAPAVQALLAQQIDALFTDIGSAQAFITAGKLRMLAVAGDKRLAQVPGVPTLAEAGYRDVGIPAIWLGIVGPPGMPQAVVDKVNDAVSKEVQTPEMEKFLLNLSLTPLTGTPEQLGARLKSDVGAWGGVIRRLGIQLD